METLESFDLKVDTKIFVSGHQGLLGSAVCRFLKSLGHTALITAPKSELDLTNQAATFGFIRMQQPELVINCAAKVGGIHANSLYPAEFAYQNLMIQANIMAACHQYDINTYVGFGSNCMYPKEAPQPMPESSLLDGPIESSNLAYAAAKICSYVQAKSYCQQYGRRYFCLIPASLYGPGDNFDPEYSHVAAALILKFQKAKEAGEQSVEMWGTGKPRRELLYVDDAAKGIFQILKQHDPLKGPINLGYGKDHSIRDIADTIAEVVGYKGEITQVLDKPDGTLQKLLDSSLAESYGYAPTVDLRTGVARTLAWLNSGLNSEVYIRGITTRPQSIFH